MKQSAKVLVTFGTRPEAIKMAPVVLALQKQSSIETALCVTGQHREMLDQVLEVFRLTPDFDMNVMTPRQTLASTSAKILTGFTEVLEEHRPDIVVVHGDTTTSYIAAVAAFYQKIPVAHVEAGLRTGNMLSPWPEEFNRRSIANVASLHFAPTLEAKSNLLSEKVAEATIEVTGNTVIDALRITGERLHSDEAFRTLASEQLMKLRPDVPTILVTAHRRENLEGGIESICGAISALAKANIAQFIFPVHRNPRVEGVVNAHLAALDNVHLTAPLDYPELVNVMMHSHILLTDSGGIQEEAAALRKPCLVMRNTTERPELIAQGGGVLVGTDIQMIVKWVEHLISDKSAYQAMQLAVNPYGDGHASERIATTLAKFLTQP